MLCINSHIIHVSLLQTSICWQEKEDFDVGPLGFLDKNVESETLPSLSRESGWSKKTTLSSHLSFSKWGELLLSTHALPPTPYPITHKCTQTQAHTLGGLHCLLGNKSKSCQVLWHNMMLIHSCVCQNAKDSSNDMSLNQNYFKTTTMLVCRNT